MQNGPKGKSAHKNLYKRLSKRAKKARIEVIREKSKQESAQEKRKSLLEIKKEQEKFSKASKELHEKRTTVQAKYPGLFAQIEAYYPCKKSPLFKVFVGLKIVALLFTFLVGKSSLKDTVGEDVMLTIYVTLSLTVFGLLMVIYNLYDSYMHPAGLFMADTGFLYIEEGKKLKYTFVRYQHVKEILRDVKGEALFIKSTQSTHDASSKENGAEPQILKINVSDMEKEVMDLLYEHLSLKIAAEKAKESRLST